MGGWSGPRGVLGARSGRWGGVAVTCPWGSRWSYQPPSWRGPAGSTLRARNDRVAVVSTGPDATVSSVQALDPASGRVLWSSDAGGRTIASVTASPGRVLLGTSGPGQSPLGPSSDAVLEVLNDRDGSEQRRIPVPDSPPGVVAVAGDVAVVHRFGPPTAFDLVTGARLWSVDGTVLPVVTADGVLVVPPGFGQKDSTCSIHGPRPFGRGTTTSSSARTRCTARVVARRAPPTDRRRDARTRPQKRPCAKTSRTRSSKCSRGRVS